MFTRRIFFTSTCLLNKQISKVMYPNKRSVIYCRMSGFNSCFSTEKAMQTFPMYPLYFLDNTWLKVKLSKALKTWRSTPNRFYSGDPSISFLSGGKSNYFEDNAAYGADRLLNKIIGQLKEDNGVDICVIETSEERRKYADYVVVVSGRSTRHLKAMANHIHQQSKKDFPEKHVNVTGLDSDDWMIIDFGLIVIHLFLPEIREKYELERLWSLGPEHDKQYQEMLEGDRYAEMVKNAKLQDFFVNEEASK